MIVDCYDLEHNNKTCKEFEKTLVFTVKELAKATFKNCKFQKFKVTINLTPIKEYGED